MRRLLAHLLAHPLESALAAAAVCGLGLYGALHMSVDLFPSLDVPVVNVITHAPGTAPEDLDLLVTRPVEDALRGAVGVRRVASTTLQGISIVTVQFSWTVDVGTAAQTVSSRLAQVAGTLPAGATPRLEQIGTTLQEVGGWAVYGAGDPAELATAVSRDLAARLMSVEGVSQIEVMGGEQPAMLVRARPERLAAAGLTLEGVAAAIRSANGIDTAGFLTRSDEDVVVRADSRVVSAADLAAVPVPLAGGGSVPLESVASVEPGWTPRHYAVKANLVPAVVFFVRKQPGASAIAVVDGVRRELGRADTLLPEGSRVLTVYDQSEVLRSTRRAIVHELLVGAVLAVAVLWLLLGSPRPTVAVAVTIPVSMLAAVGVLWLLGQSLNVITMAGLTLAVGMIVDDAIVVAENVFRHRERGASPGQAALAGTAEIAAPDASGTFTTVAAFLPLVLVTGLAAVFLRPFGLTVSAALLASLVLSLTVVPAILSRAPHEHGTGRPRHADRVLAAGRRRLDRWLRWAMAHRGATLAGVAAAVLILGGSVVLRHGPVGLLPPVDEGALLVEYVLPPGVSLAESDRVASEIARRARALDGVVAVEQRAGSAPGGLQVEGVDRGELLVKLAPLSSDRPSADAVTARLRAATAGMQGVVLLFHQPTQEKMDESLAGLPALFGVTVYGDDADALDRAAGQVAALLRRDPDVSSVVDNARFRRPQVTVRVDGERCAALGVRPAEVRAAVAAAVWGRQVLEVVRARQRVAVLLQTDPAGGAAALAALPVSAGDGRTVPLGSVADVVDARVPDRVTRLNGRRELTILASVSGVLPLVAARVDRQLAALDLPAGTSATVTGQYRVLLETVRDLALVLAGAAFLVVAIMTLQFGSLRQALWVLAMVPVAFAGAAAGVAVTASGLNVAVAIALLTLLGIVVNNGIVLVDLANREPAASAEEGLAAAAGERLRPILATSLTTIAGLTPTALGLGSGEHVFQPFAVAVIAGLAAATAATLVVLPAMVLPATRRRQSSQPTADS